MTTDNGTLEAELTHETVRGLMVDLGYDVEYEFENLLEHIEQEACPSFIHRGTTYEF